MRDYMDRRVTRPPTEGGYLTYLGVPHVHVNHYNPTFERIFNFIDLFDLLLIEFFFTEK